MLPRLDLVADRPRPAQGPRRAASASRTMPAGLLDAARRGGGSVPAVLLAGLYAVLSRYTGQDDIAVASPAVGGTRVLRVTACDPTFTELIAECERAWRDAARCAAGTDAAVPYPLSVSVCESPDQTGPFEEPAEDIAVRVAISDRGIEAHLRYATDLYAHSRMVALLRHWERALRAGTDDPSTHLSCLPLLDRAEHAELLAAGQGAARPYPRATLHALVGARMLDTPDAVAGICAGDRLTYRELDRRSATLARYLHGRGVGPGSIVAVVLDRGLHTLVGMLGVLRAGAAYTPVDPTFPAERIAFVLREVAAPVVLTRAALAGAVPAVDGVEVLRLDADWPLVESGHAAGPSPVATDPDALAYVLFTSGSTGTPKGVQLAHDMIVNYVTWMVDECRIDSNSRVLHGCSPVFDLSVGEIFSALTSGACVVVATRDEVLSPGTFTALIARERVTHTFTPPTLLNMVDPVSCADLRCVLACGEVLAPDLVGRWLDVGARVLNLYGPAEAAVACTFHECVPDGSGRPVPIGTAMPNRVARVVDRYGNLVPVGVAGELMVGGAGVARGYLNRPDLTAQRFVTDPWSGQPAYRTGDLARWNTDRELEFLGREDTQVKVNGLRIELGEIESVLTGHADVTAAAAVVRGEAGAVRIVAYVTAAGRHPSPIALREHASRFLPAYMVPSAFVTLDAFPLGATGKVDRRALPAPADTRPELDTVYREPCSPRQRALAALVSGILGVSPVGADDDFFDLGGTSLDVARLCARLDADGDVAVPVSQVYRTPTVAALAGWFDGVVATTVPDRPVPAVDSAGAPAADVLPLAPGQANLVEVTALSVCPVTWWIDGAIDIAALRAALGDVHRRHQALHACYVPGRPATARLPVDPGEPEVHTLHDVADDEAALATLDDVVQRPLEISAGRVWRAALVRSRDSDRMLFGIGVHHVAFDGPSQAIIVDDLVRAYAARCAGHVPAWERPAPTLVDMAVQAARTPASVDLPAQRSYWLEQLRTMRRAGLPGMRRGPAPAWGPKDGRLFDIPAAALPAWDTYARSVGITRFGYLVAVFGQALSRVTGQPDVAMMVPVARRGNAVLDTGVGCRLDGLCLRLRPAGGGTADWLGEAIRVVGDAMKAQDLPFGEIVVALAGIRPDIHILATLPTFLLQDHDRPPLSLAGARASEVMDRLAKEVPTPLTVEVIPVAAGLTVRITVRTDVLAVDLADRIGEEFVRVLAAGPVAA